jgi:hypothetical protein
MIEKDNHQNDNVHQKRKTNEAKNGLQKQTTKRQHLSNQRKTLEVKTFV